MGREKAIEKSGRVGRLLENRPNRIQAVSGFARSEGDVKGREKSRFFIFSKKDFELI